MDKIKNLLLAVGVFGIIIFAILWKCQVSEKENKIVKWNDFLKSFHSFQMRKPTLIESVAFINENKCLKSSSIVPYISIGMEQDGLMIFLNNWEYDDYCYFFDSNYVFNKKYRIYIE